MPLPRDIDLGVKAASFIKTTDLTSNPGPNEYQDGQTKEIKQASALGIYTYQYDSSIGTNTLGLLTTLKVTVNNYDYAKQTYEALDGNRPSVWYRIGRYGVWGSWELATTW